VRRNPSNRSTVLLLLGLSLLSVAGNLLSVPLFFGVDLIFGSIAVMLSVVLLGVLPAVLVAIVGGVYTLILWGHPYALAIFSIEALTVGLLYRRGLRNLVIADLTFWLALGVPLVLLFYRGVIGMGWEATFLIAFKQPLNGIFNTLIAGLVVLAVQLFWTGGQRMRLGSPRLTNLLFHVLLTTILLSGAVPIIHDGHRQRADREAFLLERLIEQAGHLAGRISGDPTEDGVVWQEELTRARTNAEMGLALVGPDGRLIAGQGDIAGPTASVGEIQELEGGLTILLPAGNLPVMEQWRRGRYEASVPVSGVDSVSRIVVTQAAEPLVRALEAERLTFFIYLSVLLVLGIFTSRILSRWLTRPLCDLEVASANMAQEIAEGVRPSLPDNAIQEYRSLGTTLGDMANRLRASFNELHEIQAGLEEEIQARTVELAHLSRVASQTTNGVVITDTEGCVEWINEGFTRITGYTLDDLRGRKPGDVLQGTATDPATVKRMRDALERGVSFAENVVNYTKSGQFYWVHISCNPLRDVTGKPQGFMAIETDITREKSDADRIRASERRLAAVIEGTNIGAWEWNVQTGETTFNERWAGIVGHTLAELEPISIRTWMDLAHPDDLKNSNALLERHFANQSDYYDFQCRMRHKDGHWVWVHDRGRVVSWTEDGKPLLMCGTHADITEQKHAETTLQDQAKQTQAILDNMVDGIITIGETGEIDSFNPAAERIFSYRMEELLGRNVKTLIPNLLCDGDEDCVRRHLMPMPADGTGARREVDGRRKDGAVFPLELAISEVTREGRPLYVGLVRDISERKEMDRIKSEFVSKVSHELRTPLTSIRGSLGLIVGGALGELPSQMRNIVDIAHRNCQRLTHLINDLLDIEKLTADQMYFAMEPQALMPLIHQALKENEPFGAARGVTLVVTRSEPYAYVRVDAQRLMQVLCNLLSNAIKFSPKDGTVEIAVATRDRSVRVTVSDRGPGIPAAFRPRVFQKFAQADCSDARKRGGTGLGLAISKELIDRMNGKIGFESIEGEGASFNFDLPLSSLWGARPPLEASTLPAEETPLDAEAHARPEDQPFEPDPVARRLGRSHSR
jgi:PAS domain S-box-containing protein